MSECERCKREKAEDDWFSGTCPGPLTKDCAEARIRRLEVENERLGRDAYDLTSDLHAARSRIDLLGKAHAARIATLEQAVRELIDEALCNANTEADTVRKDAAVARAREALNRD